MAGLSITGQMKVSTLQDGYVDEDDTYAVGVVDYKKL